MSRLPLALGILKLLGLYGSHHLKQGKHIASTPTLTVARQHLSYKIQLLMSLML